MNILKDRQVFVEARHEGSARSRITWIRKLVSGTQISSRRRRSSRTALATLHCTNGNDRMQTMTHSFQRTLFSVSTVDRNVHDNTSLRSRECPSCDMIPEVEDGSLEAPPQPTIVHNTVQNSGVVKRHAASEGLARVLPNTCEESRCKCK